jgi:periplasmic protein TonB
MFESVKQNDRPNGVVYAASLMISLLAHATIICLLILIPLVFFSSLEAEELLSFLYLPPQPPLPPDPPPPPRPQPKPNSVHIQGGDVAPRAIPQGIDIEAPADDPIDTTSIVQRIGSIGGQDTIGIEKGIENMLLASNSIKEPEAPRRPGKRELVRVASIEPSRLIRKVDPVYPELARRARISGDVILDAVIDEEGNVTSLKVLSGHPLLVEAARQAVLQWKYSPTILSGEPVAILANVTVSFRLK